MREDAGPSQSSSTAATGATSTVMATQPSDGGANVPSGFILKLYQMVNGAPNEVISWTTAGDAFIIGSDLDRLESETLPQFFRHNRFQSLVRQLNFYSFRKINRERNVWVYKHPLFHRDRPEELHLVRRRTCPGVDGRKQRFSRNRPNSAAQPYTDNPAAGGGGMAIPDTAQSPAPASDVNVQHPRLSSGDDESVEEEYTRHKVESSPAPPPNVKRAPYDSPVLAGKRVCRIWGSPEAKISSPPIVSSVIVDTSMLEMRNSHPSPSPTSVFHARLIASNEEDTADDSSAAKRCEKTEMLEQSMVVSKVAMKLEEYARKAMKERGMFRTRRGGGGVVTPPWGSVQTFEGVNQGLLTYDDEASGFGSSRDWSMTGNFSTDILPVVKPANKISKSASMVSLNDFEAKQEDEFRVPPVNDVKIIESVASSLFPNSGFLGIPVNINSIVVKFCMSTPPYEDERLHSRLTSLVSESIPLSNELRNYRLALHPLRVSGVSGPNRIQSYADLTSAQQHQPHLDYEKSSDMMRDFKIFAVNRMRKMLGGRGLSMSEEQRRALSHTADIWWKSVAK